MIIFRVVWDIYRYQCGLMYNINKILSSVRNFNTFPKIMFKFFWKEKKNKSPVGFDLMTCGLVEKSLNHCTPLLCDRYG